MYVFRCEGTYCRGNRLRRIRIAGSLLLALVIGLAAGPAGARPLGFTLSSDTLLFLAGNSVVDIRYDTVMGVPTVWVGTGTGASKSTDFGVIWRAFTTNQGLSASSISALHIQDDTVWIGMAHNQDFGGDLFPVGDGFNLSDDGGETWDTSRPAQSTGIGFFSQQIFGMLPFDFTGEPSGLWAACFFGGLIRSTDGGVTWFNVYPSDSSRVDFESKSYSDLANRYFSCVAGLEDAAGDTVEVYAGSANGINRFLVIDAKVKLAGAPVLHIHTDPQGAWDWLATDGGVSRLSRTVPAVTKSYFDSTTAGAVAAGFYQSSASPLNPLVAYHAIFGPFDTSGVDTIGLGLSRWDSTTDTWSLVTPPPLVGTNLGAYELLYSHQALWAATRDSGMQRSVNAGATWQRVYLDTLDTNPASGVNKVFSLAFDSIPPRQIYAGTDAGIYRVTLDASDDVVGWEPALYSDTSGDTTGAQIIRGIDAFHNQYGDLLLWAASQAPAGDPILRSASLYSNDTGQTWQTIHADLLPWAYAYLDSTLVTNDSNTVFAATEGGLMQVSLAGVNYVSDTVLRVFETRQGRTDSTELLSPFRAVVTIRDTIWLGGAAGWARQRPGNLDWDLDLFIPRDSVDLIQTTTFEAGSDSSISGNFVIALELQLLRDTIPPLADTQYIWASTRPVEGSQFLGVSRSIDNGRTWEVSHTGRITWNFASYKRNVWAASADGLYHTINAGTTWTAIPIVADSQNTAFQPGTEILSVRQLDDSTLLVGSEDGIARTTDLGKPDTTWTITRSFVPVGSELAGGSEVRVYASPVPDAPNSASPRRIHYKPAQSGNVSIRVFDFAMQLVATVLDGEFRSGVPAADPRQYYEEWNARNDKSQMVATGVYFFRVEMPGDTQWGKLVILP